MKYIPLMAGPSRPSKLRTRDLNNMKSSLVSLKPLWFVFPSALIFHNTLNLFIHKVLFFNYVPQVPSSRVESKNNPRASCPESAASIAEKRVFACAKAHLAVVVNFNWAFVFSQTTQHFVASADTRDCLPAIVEDRTYQMPILSTHTGALVNGLRSWKAPVPAVI